ncbi:MAG: hypothetical protein FJ125_16820 [Deltaproteobacteria bacterium]|nr:hypothetical protein [Deltaproteobacteria bacterium]
MRRAIPLLLAALLLARVAPALADLPDELARTQRTLEAAEQRLAGGRTELQRRAAMHDHLVARIEELKRGPIQSFRLEALQRSARTMAEERSMLQQRVTQAEQEIVRLRSLLQQRAQQQLSSLQARQPDDAGDKLRWMQQQQELLALLRRLEPQGGIETLPTMPQGVVRSSDGPEELRELADEMADVAEKYMAHAHRSPGASRSCSSSSG